jgi:RNA polymerase sigma-70 factor (ECF subfamily)
MSMVAVRRVSPQEDLESYRPLLVSVISKRVDRDDVEDIVQEALIRALKGIDGLRDPRSQSLWLFKIALRSVFDYYAKRSSARALETRICDTQPEPKNEAFEVYERQQLVERLLEKLSKEERELVNLFFFRDMSVEAIGDIYGIAGSSIRVRLHRIKQKLRGLVCEDEFCAFASCN